MESGYPITPVIFTMLVFIGMMAVSFGQGMHGIVQAKSHEQHMGQLAEADDEFDQERENAILRRQVIIETVVAEGIDTLLVLLAILFIARPLRGGPTGTWPYAWLLGFPTLALVLGLNIGFAYFIRVATGAETPPDTDDINLGWKQGIVAILLLCAQPAIIEELFFRYLLYGHLRPHLGIHWAVMVSSIVFAMAHLGGVIGWPILALAGVMLGYARVYSGGLALPIILHFFHNFFVLLMNHLLFNA